jgi:hypothetical protein
MQCKQALEYAHIKCKQLMFMSLLPLLVCFFCPRILIPLIFFNVAPSLSNIIYLSPLIISWSNFISLYNLFPFVINFYKRCASHWCKGLHWGRWLRLKSSFLMDTTTYVEMTHLYSSWDTTHRIFDLDTNLWDTSPYVIAVDICQCTQKRIRKRTDIDEHFTWRF